MTVILSDLNVTEEQRQAEKSLDIIAYDLYYKRISEDEARKKFNKLLKRYCDNGVFSKTDIKNLSHRADRDKGDLIKFGIRLINTHLNENKYFLIFFDKRVKVKYPEARWEYWGADFETVYLIANFHERKDTANFPDYKIFINDKLKFVFDLKVFKTKFHWFKRYNLNKYINNGVKPSEIVVRGENNHYYIYSIKAVEFLLKQKFILWEGKYIIKVSPYGGDGMINLKNLIKNELVNDIGILE